MARGVTGTGVGFDAAAAGRVGGRWRNPSEAEQRLAIFQVHFLVLIDFMTTTESELSWLLVPSLQSCLDPTVSNPD